MSRNAFEPKPEHKFTFGLWTVGNRGRDPFGDFVRPVASRGNKDEGVAKVVVVSGNGDLVIEHPNGALRICKANELGTADDQAA